jgi:hypothetical protein
MIMSNNTGFKTIAHACKRELENIKDTGRELWTARLEAFLGALSELEIDHDFNGHDAMTIIDLDRLRVAAIGNVGLEKYIGTLLPSTPVSEGNKVTETEFQSPATSHAQHLKVIALIVPVIADFA